VLLRRLVAAVILVPLAIIIIAFAVANRQTATVSFDPFSPNEPAASVALPLFVPIIVALILGVLIGGVASWLRQGKWRGAARRFERELHRLREKVHALEGTAAKPATGPGAGEPQQRLRLRPPAR
jgi:uncharacterized integral membrane protein